MWAWRSSVDAATTDLKSLSASLDVSRVRVDESIGQPRLNQIISFLPGRVFSYATIEVRALSDKLIRSFAPQKPPFVRFEVRSAASYWSYNATRALPSREESF